MPAALSPATKLGPVSDADHGDEGGQADVVEHPQRGRGNAPESRVHRAQITANQSRHQRTAAGAQAERHLADFDDDARQ